MTNGLALRTLLMAPLFLASGTRVAGQAAVPEAPAQGHALGPDRKLSLCEFVLRGAAGSNTAPLVGVLGAAYDARKMQKDMPYAMELRTAFIGIYEDSLGGTGAFPYIPMGELVYQQYGEPMPVDTMTRANGLHACLTARSDLMVKFGWSKKVEVATAWELRGQSGWTLKIKTSAISRDGQGKFPDMANPAMKPVLLELARESVHQLLARLESEGMLVKSPRR